MLRQLDPGILTDKNQRFAGKNRRREIISQYSQSVIHGFYYTRRKGFGNTMSRIESLQNNIKVL
jgi:hypothetical protein